MEFWYSLLWDILSKFHPLCQKCWWITLNSENGLNSDCQWQMRWAYLPVIIERRVEWPMENMKTIFEATRALSVLFFKSRPGGGPALKPHRRPFQATFLSSIFFQTGDKKPLHHHSKLLLKHIDQPENFAYRHLESCSQKKDSERNCWNRQLLIYCFGTIIKIAS